LFVGLRKFGMEGLVFTRISFAYFGGKRKEEGKERKI